ncbi:MAG: S4 domain-containing protein [Halopseudomonas yangmingensis]|uniref:Heat shock protein 15 n=1 Tax=Halopseudomonas yangmingensis TaxID=1720063 RepID=A0A1I4P5I9_9GAMM|nr:S4 domain-containing protein [Halopseudomonas yangmingensis]SFM22807.1 ribosome-associated heat shock protein Hsp15 [Halopseudomonas yangmingensis]
MADDQRIRLDKWLWAARFFKTRALAKAAIEGGKVQCAGDRCKPSKEPRVGELLQIRQGADTRIVEVLALSGQRRGAPEAALLYRETAESLAQREQLAAQRRALGAGLAISEQRPTKKQRRQIHRFRDERNVDGGNDLL